MIVGPVLYPLHDLLVPGLHLGVVGPMGGEDLLVAGELRGPAQVEAGHYQGQVVGLDHLVVGSNLGHLGPGISDINTQQVISGLYRNVTLQWITVGQKTHSGIITSQRDPLL